MRWSVITKCDSFLITKYDKCYYKVRLVLQSVTILLQSATAFYYKVRQVLLQSATGITKCDNLLQSATGITKCDDYYKVRQYTLAFFISVHFFTALGKSAT